MIDLELSPGGYLKSEIFTKDDTTWKSEKVSNINLFKSSNKVTNCSTETPKFTETCYLPLFGLGNY